MSVAVQSEVTDVEGNPAFAAAFAGSPAGMLLTRSADGTIVEINRSLLRMTGYARNELVGQDPLSTGLMAPALVIALRQQIAAHGRLHPTEITLARRDGSPLIVVASTETITIHDALHRLTVFTDITAQKLAEHRLSVRHDVGRELVEGTEVEPTGARVLETLCRSDGFAAGGIYLVNGDGILRCAAFWHDPAHPSDAFAADSRAIAFVPGHGLLGRVMATATPVSMAVTTDGFLRRSSAQACGLAHIVAFPIMRGDKVLGVFDLLSTHARELDATAHAHYEAVSQLLGLYVARMQAEGRQRSSEARLRTVIDALKDGIIIADATGKLLHWNPQALALHGLERSTDFERALGDFTTMYRMVRLDGAPLHYEQWPVPRILRGEALHDEEIWLERVDSTWRRAFRYGGSLIHQVDGTQIAVLTIADVTDRVLATRALHQIEERFRLLTENIDEVFYITKPDNRDLEYISPGYERTWGRSCGELLDAPSSWLDALHPDDRERVAAALPHQAAGTYDEEYRILRPDGSLRWIRDHAFPVRSAEGSSLRVVGIARDITNERALRDQFQQSQKLEGIGQLAGGVAHDFNNILSVMLMNLDLLRPHTQEPQVAVLVQEAIDAGRRAAALTRQLLLFSRRETMTMRSVELNEIVRGMMQMLTRMLGEHVQIEVNLAPQSLPITADINMVEQVLLNLAINARDAMGPGGKLAVMTELVGADAVLRVTDTGCGIPESIRQSIWEPFFTTKEVGKGTGLGLSTVYGIVKQHRGWVSCESTLGTGTTFSVGIPLGQAAPAPLPTPVPATLATRGDQVVLLVEDNDSLRSTLMRVLRRSGYRVLAAASAEAALAVWQQHRAHISVLVTDQVMPGELTGSQLAAALLAERPELAVVTMSGYDPSHPGGTLVEDPRWSFLAKPFEPAALTAAITALLTARRVGRRD